MKKKVLLILSGLVVLTLATVIGGYAWVKSRLSKEALVRQLEETWNCRAQLETSKVDLTSRPARVELLGLKLAPRDEEVGKALANRAPLNNDAVLASMDRAVLVVELTDLMHGRLNVKQLHLYGLNAITHVRPDGESDIKDLFSEPGTPAKATPPVEEPEKKHSEHVVVTTPAPAPPKPEAPAPPTPPAPTETAPPTTAPTPATTTANAPHGFGASDLHLQLHVDEAGVDDANFTIYNPSNATAIRIEHVTLSLSNIDVNPADLKNHDHCDVQYSGAFHAERTDDKSLMADFHLTGKGNFSLFDSDNGEWSPNIRLDCLINKGAQLGGQPLDQSMSKKDLASFKDWGIDLSGIAAGGILGQDAKTRVHMFNGKTIINDDTHLVFPDYEITLLEGSSLNAGQDSIKAHLQLVAGPTLTKRVMDQADQFVRKQITATIGAGLGDTLGGTATDLLKKKFINDKQQLDLKLSCKGRLSNPTVELEDGLMNFANFLQDSGKGFLEGLLGPSSPAPKK